MYDSECEEILDAFIQRQLVGKAESVDQLCAAHPQHAETLRRRLALLGAVGPNAADEDQRTLPRSFDGFEIVRELGQGGMGVVFEAEQPALGRRVAIKVLSGLGALSARLRERFEREIGMLARIRHPNVVKVFGSGVVDGAPYVAMELIEGQSLAEKLLDGASRAATSDWRASVSIVARIARALDHVHELGVIHRDVKPSNIVLDRRGEPVLIDFGLAREAESDALTRTGEFVGTLAYTSPEQARGERVDRRADVYGLGATLFHLVTGEPPYRASTIADLVRRIESGPPSSARRIRRSVPVDLSTVLEHALAVRPMDRYASCADFAMDLEAVLEGRPIQAQRRSLPVRAWRFLRRRKSAAALSTALALAALSTSAVAWRWRSDAVRAAEGRRTSDRLEAMVLGLSSGGQNGGGSAADSTATRLDEIANRWPDDRTCQWIAALWPCRPHVSAGLLSVSTWRSEEVERLEALLRDGPRWIGDEMSGAVLSRAVAMLRSSGRGGLPDVESPPESSSNDPGELARVAFTLQALGSHRSSTALARKAAELAPEDTAIQYLALYALRQADPLAAHRIGARLLDRLPSHPQVLMSLARTELVLAQSRQEGMVEWLPQTLEFVDRAVAAAPNDSSLLMQAGYVYHEAKPAHWQERASDLYQRSIALGDTPQARFNLHNLIWQTGGRDPDVVIELLTPIEATYGHLGTYWQNLAWAHEKRGEVARAVELLERSVEVCEARFRSEQLDWLIYMRSQMPGVVDAAAQRRDFERLVGCTELDSAGIERLVQAATTLGGAARNCVLEILIERDRAGVKLGLQAEKIMVNVRAKR